MRQIGTLPTEHQASVLTDWLLAEGIEAKFERETAGFEIWVKDEDQLERARRELEAYLANPQERRYQEAAQRAADVQRAKLERQRRFERNLQQAGPAQTRSGGLTLALILASIGVAVLTNFGEFPNGPTAAMKALAFNAVPAELGSKLAVEHGFNSEAWALKFASIRLGEFWRLVTPVFIHFGVLHLVFNLIWLYQFGRLIEGRYGSLLLGSLCLVVAIASNFAQVAVPAQFGGAMPNPQDPNLMIYLGGMSGVVYGLFGFIWVRSLQDPSSGFFLPTSTIVIMVGWLFFCMASDVGMMSGTSDGVRSSVANWAHGVGLVVGMAFAWLGPVIGSARK
ncbi:MAG: rhomboid family intramembrane serine protease [Planctomycetota bacterium]|jgi:GlpG protein|nr:rhomboid family intramembrane serine protease [Blastopirellula sp.]